jgi:heme/copper-type cytochrome/quinol oxidase subunit 2
MCLSIKFLNQLTVFKFIKKDSADSYFIVDIINNILIIIIIITIVIHGIFFFSLVKIWCMGVCIYTGCFRSNLPYIG